MATKPTVNPQWDSNLTNTSALTAGHKTDGFALNEKPTSGELNTLFNLIYTWILWLTLNVATISRTKLQSALAVTNWTAATGGISSFSGGYCWSWNTAVATATLTTHAIDLPDGYKLTNYSFALGSSSVSPTGPLIVTVVKVPQPSGTQVTLATYTVANGSFPTTATKQTLNFAAAGALSAQTVTVNAAGGTYTRSAGSYITDGFFVGQLVQWAGFTNGGNNAQKVITALSATVMTVSTTGLVNETGGIGAASVAAVSPTLDGTFSLHVTYSLTATGAGITVAFGDEQYTGVP